LSPKNDLETIVEELSFYFYFHVPNEVPQKPGEPKEHNSPFTRARQEVPQKVSSASISRLVILWTTRRSHHRESYMKIGRPKICAKYTCQKARAWDYRTRKQQQRLHSRCGPYNTHTHSLASPLHSTGSASEFRFCATFSVSITSFFTLLASCWCLLSMKLVPISCVSWKKRQEQRTMYWLPLSHMI